MGVLTMNDIFAFCIRPFVDVLRAISDFPIMCSIFAGLIAALVTQDTGIGFLVFFAAIAFLAVIYVVTFGRAFGRGGHKTDFEIKS